MQRTFAAVERIPLPDMINTRRSPSLLPLALAALLLAGCKSSTPPPAQQAQQPDQQAAPAPGQPAQQAVNPENSAAPSGSSARDRAREREEYEKGYAAAQRQGQPYPPQQSQAQPGYGSSPSQGYPAPAPQPRQAAVIPAGTHIVVTLGQTLTSKTAQAGDGFTATVAEPVVVGGATLIRAGAPASGTVLDAKALGRFKGGAELAIRLDTVRAEGRTYQVASSTVERVEKGKGKRTAVLTGGGGGLGALIGGLAGGGRGALIGGLAGAGAGGAGSAFTGNKELVIPAETALTFRLERNVPMQ